MVANRAISLIVPTMKRNRVLRELGLGVLLALPVAGCTGINASKSVAPIDFLVPGGQLRGITTEVRPLEHPVPAPEAVAVAQAVQ